jgi:hypothetical protein
MADRVAYPGLMKGHGLWHRYVGAGPDGHDIVDLQETYFGGSPSMAASVTTFRGHRWRFVRELWTSGLEYDRCEYVYVRDTASWRQDAAAQVRMSRLDRGLDDAQRAAAIDWTKPMPGYEDVTPGVWLGLSREPNLVLFARQLAAQRPIFRGGGCE